MAQGWCFQCHGRGSEVEDTLAASGGPYFLGERFSLVDIMCSVQLTVRTVRTGPEMASFGLSPAWLGVAKAKQIRLNTKPATHVQNMSSASGSTLGYSFESWEVMVSPASNDLFWVPVPSSSHVAESNTFVVGVGAHLSS